MYMAQGMWAPASTKAWKLYLESVYGLGGSNQAIDELVLRPLQSGRSAQAQRGNSSGSDSNVSDVDFFELL